MSRGLTSEQPSAQIPHIKAMAGLPSMFEEASILDAGSEFLAALKMSGYVA